MFDADLQHPLAAGRLGHLVQRLLQQERRPVAEGSTLPIAALQQPLIRQQWQRDADAPWRTRVNAQVGHGRFR